MCDGYERQDRVHVMGSIVGVLGFRYVLEAKEESTAHNELAVASAISGVLNRLESDGLAIGAVCTDNAGQCGRARRILALRYPSLVLFRCMAHQMKPVNETCPVGHVSPHDDGSCGGSSPHPLRPPTSCHLQRLPCSGSMAGRWQ